MAKKKAKSKSTKQPSVAKQSATAESINNEVIAAALSSIHQPIPLKVCRLCESKDGPFLNIFDADKVTAKKIEELMPFGIVENDDLPHKICFRCSAKVEELYEFIQKCIKTQNSLRTAMGNRDLLVTKTKTRTLWEEKLNKSNMSNDDICDALIKKAMEGIKDMPCNPLPLKEEKAPPPVIKKFRSNVETSLVTKKVIKKEDLKDVQDEAQITLKQVKLSIEKIDDKAPVTRTSRSNKSETLHVKDVVSNCDTVRKPALRKCIAINKKPKNDNHEVPVETKASVVETKVCSKSKLSSNEEDSDDSIISKESIESVKKDVQTKSQEVVLTKSQEVVSTKPQEVVPTKPQELVPVKSPEAAPFNIMDHVCTIKVNGVGVLFQCKLCNRNFLKREVVVSHGCAKNNVPKESFTKHVPLPETPKAPTVKYIKIDNDFKNPSVAEKSRPVVGKKTACAEIKPKVEKPLEPVVRPKPKIGPASKVKRQVSLLKTLAESPPKQEPTPPLVKPNTPQATANLSSLLPVVNFPSIPSLNSRYKLVMGPNNSFTLVEDSCANENPNKTVEENIPQPKPSKKRRAPMEAKNGVEIKPKEYRNNTFTSPEVIDLDDNKQSRPAAIEQPYPVGLFQTVAHHSSIYVPPAAPEPTAFMTPAMKKQSYTIVQTGNPSKLLISTKPQPIVEELPRKRQKKTKPEVKDAAKEPFTVTLEDTAPPKDTGFFTFINVDPLLQPSYVLPTDNIIQESQITTSTPVVRGAMETKDKEKYSCNMCGEKFSREKKLLAHIQSHYTKMDEEDQMRADKTTKKRGRKS